MIIAEIILHIVLARFNYLNNWNSRNELWCRDSLLGWYNAAKADEYVHGTDFHSHVRTDENGFRLDGKQTGNAILLIGDSFVQACEVDDNETFGYILEQMTDFNVINAGVAGYGTDQEMLIQQFNALEKLYKYSNNIVYAYECIASILEDENIDYIYPLDVFKREQAKGGVTFRFDKHFNERGHKLMAEILEDYINESGSHR